MPRPLLTSLNIQSDGPAQNRSKSLASPKFWKIFIFVALLGVSGLIGFFVGVKDDSVATPDDSSDTSGPSDPSDPPDPSSPSDPTSSPTKAPSPSPVSPCTYTQVFLDNFDNLDNNNWNVIDLENSHNEELQYYTSRPDNVKIEDQKLVITPKLEARGSKSWTSGRMHGKGKQSWTFGKFTVRAKLPAGNGLWSALWMLPEEDYYGTWAASGEIGEC
jgi:beta-glucanase (GH16 family)